MSRPRPRLIQMDALCFVGVVVFMTVLAVLVAMASSSMVEAKLSVSADDTLIESLRNARQAQLRRLSLVREDVLCPVCRCTLDDEILRCQSCAAPYHATCWRWIGKCSTYACGSLSANFERRSDPPPRRRAA